MKMSSRMKSLVLAAVVAVPVGVGGAVVAQQMGQPGQTERQEQGQTERQAQQRRQAEAGASQSNALERQQAQRQISVRESVIYGLSDEPRENLFKAALKLGMDPMEAAKCVKVAANHLELFAAAAESSPAGTGASAGQASSGGTSGGGELRQAARELERVGDRIRNHELTDMRQAKREFGKALFAFAVEQHRQAELGLRNGNEKQLGYTLKSAAENLAAACTFAEVNANEQVARGIYNAGAAGRQIVALNTPTTYQNNGQFLMSTEEGTTNAEPAGIFDSAQPAGGRMTPDGQAGQPAQGGQEGQPQGGRMQAGQRNRAMTIASSAQQAIQDFGTAIGSLRGQMQGGGPGQR